MTRSNGAISICIHGCSAGYLTFPRPLIGPDVYVLLCCDCWGTTQNYTKLHNPVRGHRDTGGALCRLHMRPTVPAGWRRRRRGVRWIIYSASIIASTPSAKMRCTRQLSFHDDDGRLARDTTPHPKGLGPPNSSPEYPRRRPSLIRTPRCKEKRLWSLENLSFLPRCCLLCSPTVNRRGAQDSPSSTRTRIHPHPPYRF